MWGIIPAAGRGTRIQPLAFSKELLPVGSRADGTGERPCAVSEHLIERMIVGGVDRICFVIAPTKADILQYFGDAYDRAKIAYVVQTHPAGLCDAIFRAHCVISPNEPVIVGLPDTVWFPRQALAALPNDRLSFLLFPVAEPRFYDAVMLSGDAVTEIQVKRADACSNWIWGAFKMPGAVFVQLRELWFARQCQDEYFGTLINAYLAQGGSAIGVKAGTDYVDIGTLNGYRAASTLLADKERSGEGQAGTTLAWPAGRLSLDPQTETAA
jgi:glucose-1-phosphate thymidylyltransferase